MCWKSRGAFIKGTAEEDIPVFKVMTFDNTLFGTTLKSLYYNFTYEIGRIYLTHNIDIPIEFGDIVLINKGFHSYCPKCKIKYYHHDIISIWHIKHCCLDFVKQIDNMVKANCVIPKGSLYYLNEFGEYVSNKIKIIDYECVG